MTHTQNWITHREKKVSSSSPHTYNKIFHIFLSATWVWELWNGTYRDRKIYNQKISPGIHLFQLFSFILRCGATTTTGASDKKNFYIFPSFCDVCRNYMTCERRRGERESDSKKRMRNVSSITEFLPFKDFFFRWRFYWKILFTCVLWKWNFTANLLTILQKGPKIALNDVNNEMGKIQIARGY